MKRTATLAALKPKRVKREIFCRPLSFLQDSDTYVIFDATDGKLVELNRTARHIYHCCDGERSVQEIAEELYPNCSARMLHRVEDVLLMFQRRGWIELEEGRQQGQ